MALSVFVVLVLTVLYEVLKVWRVWLSTASKLAEPSSPMHCGPNSDRSDSCSALDSSPSECSLTPIEPHRAPSSASKNKWLLHGIQTVLHVLQVSLGYLLMLCVMSYNTWIFLGVIAGSTLGYFISFPLLGKA